ncbi:MAG: protein-L-isoaspartate O-methyltransferase [Kiloniellales bacterium]|nr:protein-L-isoaspartate O-methyltransferase [Kiloniellales bacterium]MDJ0970058.1 protein-L-isoaspartate O-methyltransferase [Kiloniellales bacterium]
MFDFAQARSNMIDSQLRTNKVTDTGVLDAFAAVPRERFLPEARAGVAYIDEDLEVAPGRYLMEPMVLARLLQAARIEATDMVLDVGCTTGYSSAVLARLADTVVALESDPALCERANQTLQDLGIDNAVVVTADLTAGYEKQAPYDVILLGGAVAELPEAILSQLAEGGRLVTVMASQAHLGQAVLVRRNAGQASRRVLFDAAVRELPGFAAAPGFVF